MAQWEGRDVVFADFNIRDGRAVRAAFAKDGETGSYACLVASARYEDGSPVFASVDEIEALPFRLQQRVLRLAALAAKSNGMLDDDAADGADGADGRVTNGSGERPGPNP
jgi:hypothetical protein